MLINLTYNNLSLFLVKNLKMYFIYRIPFFILLLISLISLGQKSSINTETSTVHWLGEKVTGSHDGFISIKKGAIEVQENQIIAGEFTIDMNTITCTDIEDDAYNKKFVGHLKMTIFLALTNTLKHILN